MSGAVQTDEGPLQWWHKAENGISIVLLAIMAVVPVYAVLVRELFDVALAGANLWVQSLNLWLTFAGGALAARASAHLSLSTGSILNLEGRPKQLVAGFTSAVATAVTAMLAYASVQFVIAESTGTQTLSGGVPIWVIQLAMPIGFLVMAFRLAWKGNDSWPGRLAAFLAVGLACCLALVPGGERTWVVWVGSGLLLGAVGLGAPLFTVMGGMAMLLFYGAPIPIDIAAVPLQTFSLIQDPTLASLPLFTLAGYMLAEGGSAKRLVHLFQCGFGWMPGGVAFATILVCAFFTTFTGASGVTILALGGLLLPALMKAGYKEKFAVGLLAAAGSIGLLFPPSLPVILYGVASKVPIPDLFLGGLIPGSVLILLLLIMSVTVALRQQGLSHWTQSDVPFAQRFGEWARSFGGALWQSKYETALPVFMLVGYFGGFVTIFEAAAMGAVYAFLIEVVIHRDLHIVRDVPQVFVESAKLMGGVLIILGVAQGFTNYLVDAEMPMLVKEWVEAHVGNRIAFILILNLLLLLVGCLMDIYSAIIVIVPLIIPIAEVFGIHPVHLGILFLANLELGYLTPPVGLNLFMASFRFKISLTKVYRYALPFLGVMTVGVLLIAYVPILTTWGLEDAAPREDFFQDDLLEEGAPAVPPQLDPNELMRMLEEEGDEPEPETKPAPPPKLDMDAIFDELEGEE